MAVEKMSISEAHRKLGHISSAAIRHAVSKGFITGIVLDNDSKPEFCNAWWKQNLRANCFQKNPKTEQRNMETTYTGSWDQWGPAAVKSINRNYYLAARIDNATHETRLYFQEKKSQTFWLLQERWSLHSNPNRKQNKNCMLRLRGRIFI